MYGNLYPEIKVIKRLWDPEVHASMCITSAGSNINL